jgi:hypothetical protein
VTVAVISVVPPHTRGDFPRIAHDGAGEQRGRRGAPPVACLYGRKVVRPHEVVITGTAFTVGKWSDHMK